MKKIIFVILCFVLMIGVTSCSLFDKKTTLECDIEEKEENLTARSKFTVIFINDKASSNTVETSITFVNENDAKDYFDDYGKKDSISIDGNVVSFIKENSNLIEKEATQEKIAKYLEEIDYICK